LARQRPAALLEVRGHEVDGAAGDQVPEPIAAVEVLAGQDGAAPGPADLADVAPVLRRAGVLEPEQAERGERPGDPHRLGRREPPVAVDRQVDALPRALACRRDPLDPAVALAPVDGPVL